MVKRGPGCERERRRRGRGQGQTRNGWLTHDGSWGTCCDCKGLFRASNVLSSPPARGSVLDALFVPLFSRFLALLHAEAVLRHAYSHYNEHKTGKLQGISTRHGGCVCARERGMQTERNERNDAYAMDGERGAASVEYAGDAGRAAEAEPCRGREKVRVLASTRPARLRSSTRTSTGEMDARTSSSKAGTRSPTTTLPSTAVEAVEEAGATR
jgi:hypothetical protein